MSEGRMREALLYDHWRNKVQCHTCERHCLIAEGELGSDTPWHLTGYYPAYKFREESYVPPTPVSTLEKARDIGSAEGLKYVYVGNVPGHLYESTYCPGCHQLLIERYSSSIVKYSVSPDKRCPYCGGEIPIIGEAMPQS